MRSISRHRASCFFTRPRCQFGDDSRARAPTMGEKNVLTSAPFPPTCITNCSPAPGWQNKMMLVAHYCITRTGEKRFVALLEGNGGGTEEGTRIPFYSLYRIMFCFDCVPLWGEIPTSLMMPSQCAAFSIHDSGPHSPKMCTSKCKRALAVLSAVSMNVSCGCVSSSRRALASLSEVITNILTHWSCFLGACGARLPNLFWD